MVLTIVAVAVLLIIVLLNETSRLILLGIVGIPLVMMYFAVAGLLFIGIWLYIFGPYFFPSFF